MEKSVILPLKDIVQYLEPLEHYWGIYDQTLLLARSSLKEKPESKIEIIERVTKEKIGATIDDAFPEMDKSVKAELIPLLWLVANIYHRKMTIEYEKFFEEYERELTIWEEIKPEIIKLFVFMQEHKNCKKVTIRFGKGKENAITLNNEKHWFHRLMSNQLFPNTIPDVENPEQAKALLRKKPGRPREREREIAIVSGVARLLNDHHLVKEVAPLNLREFIKSFLAEMEFADPFIDEDWIKTEIHQNMDPAKDVRFPTIPVVEPDKEFLASYIKRFRPLMWLVVGGYPPED